jgi:beta-phosphoglucomutase-like phosphatase (HAD superfamily)
MENARRIRAVIFDLDGVMINSERLSLKGWNLVLAPYGGRISEQDYRTLIGKDE